MDRSPYSKEFYENLNDQTERSAREIVPIIMQLTMPESVIDVGCGEGRWLAEFANNGVADILGIDGDYIDLDRLAVPQDRFVPVDLRRPIELNRTFDLAICLEVAEHLPVETAESFVDFLAGLAPMVLFSAAIPFQGGNHHLNEQWLDYWVALFERKGFVAVDCLRKRIWKNDLVAYWYAQNMLLFVRQCRLSDWPLLEREMEDADDSLLSMVHPRQYMHAVWMKMLFQAVLEVRDIIHPTSSFIVIDDAGLGTEHWGNGAVCFLEKDGSHWGPPKDDASAIEELEALHEKGVEFLVVLWSAFWWLDYYKELKRYLDSNFHRLIRNERLMVFDMRNRPE